MTSKTKENQGSFRDPSGRIYEHDGRIFRTVNEVARSSYESARDNGVFVDLEARRRLVSTVEVPVDNWPEGIPTAAYLLEHERVRLISYPYEWCFGQLKAAALHHLDLQIDLLERNFVLSDATAYNIQFIGAKPIFIDVLSVRPYVEGEFWQGHRQFCEQFLNPLLLRSLFGVAHNGWFRGNLEGIASADLARLLSLRHNLSWNILSHVTLQAKAEAHAVSSPVSALEKAKRSKSLSRMGYQGILTQLRNWIEKLHPANQSKTIWGDYAKTNTYTNVEADVKKQAVRDFAARVQPRTLVDLGCNTGDYSVAALEGGAESVIGFDFDQRAVDLAYAKAVEQSLNYLPLWLDAANPSPNQGWRQAERLGFAERVKADAMIALAFEHHLAIGKNAPLPQVVDWLIQTAPTGIIEFVPKHDETVQQMLALRDDVFADYSEETFLQSLEAKARVVNKQVVSSSGRTLFTYEKMQ